MSRVVVPTGRLAAAPVLLTAPVVPGDGIRTRLTVTGGAAASGPASSGSASSEGCVGDVTVALPVR